MVLYLYSPISLYVHISIFQSLYTANTTIVLYLYRFKLLYLYTVYTYVSVEQKPIFSSPQVLSESKYIYVFTVIFGIRVSSLVSSQEIQTFIKVLLSLWVIWIIL